MKYIKGQKLLVALLVAMLAIFAGASMAFADHGGDSGSGSGDDQCQTDNSGSGSSSSGEGSGDCQSPCDSYAETCPAPCDNSGPGNCEDNCTTSTGTDVSSDGSDDGCQVCDATVGTMSADSDGDGGDCNPCDGDNSGPGSDSDCPCPEGSTSTSMDSDGGDNCQVCGDGSNSGPGNEDDCPPPCPEDGHNNTSGPCQCPPDQDGNPGVIINPGEECPGATPPTPQCSDGIDNDGDGRTDFSTDPNKTDPGCTDANDSNEADDPQCFDRVDNDGDGDTDFSSDPNKGDPGCSSIFDNNEADDPTCSRGGLLDGSTLPLVDGRGTILNNRKDEKGALSGPIHSQLEPVLPKVAGISPNAVHEVNCDVPVTLGL